ncbi:MAG: hypothetical protein K6F71_12645 [Ruminococcus sp.]|uniref:hypothetical protein n=1 Tax=Ruminococcus sp. TaxID=41978 RepID=UPI0025CC8793|nr:hypothetical protein [Ruminococcus sp.]MCR5541648.1 hypothetical protein [Ruminococcus sp.]
MKNTIKIISILILFLTVTSCAKVPDNISERDNKLNNTENYSESNYIQRLSLDEIRNNLDEDASGKYGTITVKNVFMSNSENMPTYKISVDTRDYSIKDISQYLYGKRYNIDDDSLYEFIPWNDEGNTPVINKDPYTKDLFDYIIPPSLFYDCYSFYPDSDMTCSAHVYTDGTCWGSQCGINKDKDNYDAPWLGETVAHYYPDIDDIVSIKYKMSDGTDWLLADAINFTEDFWNSELSKSDLQNYIYKVKRVDAIKLPIGDNYGYLFYMSYIDEDGNHYDTDSYNDFLIEEHDVYDNKRFLISQNNWQLSLRKDEITRFTKDFSFKKNEIIDENKEFITLRSALSILERELADNINLEFETGQLCYAITCDKYPHNEYDGTVQYSPRFCYKYCDIYIRPYWVFKVGNGFSDNWNTAENYYVDAISGEIKIIKRENQ